MSQSGIKLTESLAVPEICSHIYDHVQTLVHQAACHGKAEEVVNTKGRMINGTLILSCTITRNNKYIEFTLDKAEERHYWNELITVSGMEVNELGHTE